MPDWFPVDVVQAALLYIVPALCFALFLGWLAGAIGLLGNVTRR